MYDIYLHNRNHLLTFIKILKYFDYDKILQYMNPKKKMFCRFFIDLTWFNFFSLEIIKFVVRLPYTNIISLFFKPVYMFLILFHHFLHLKITNLEFFFCLCYWSSIDRDIVTILWWPITLIFVFFIFY